MLHIANYSEFELYLPDEPTASKKLDILTPVEPKNYLWPFLQ